MYYASSTTIDGNLVGVNPNGTAALANAYHSVEIYEDSLPPLDFLISTQTGPAGALPVGHSGHGRGD